MNYNSIESALRSESKPCTFVELMKATGLPMARVRAEFVADESLYSLMWSNKEQRRKTYVIETVAAIESLAKREGITNRKAAIKLGLCCETHRRFKRTIASGKFSYKKPKAKNHAKLILEAAKEGATSVLEAARMKGVPPGAIHGSIGNSKEIYDLVNANAAADKDKRYRKGYKAICERLAMGETIREASDNSGLDRNFYYRCRKYLGIDVKPKPDPVTKQGLPGGAYNRLLMGKLTGQTTPAA